MIYCEEHLQEINKDNNEIKDNINNNLLNKNKIKYNLNVTNFKKKLSSTIKCQESWIYVIEPINKKLILGCFSDGSIKIYNIKSKKCIKTYLLHKKYIQCLLKLNNLSYISAGADKILKIWNVNTGQIQNKIDVSFYEISCLQILDKNHLIVGDGHGDLLIISLKANKVIYQWRGHMNKIQKIQMIQKNKFKNFKFWGYFLITCSQDGKVKFWGITYSLDGRKLLYSFSHFKSCDIKPTSLLDINLPNYFNLIIGYNNGDLIQLNYSTEEFTLLKNSHNFLIEDIQNINDKYFATSSRDRYIKFLDKATCECLCILPRMQRSIESFCTLGYTTFITTQFSKILIWK